MENTRVKDGPIAPLVLSGEERTSGKGIRIRGQYIGFYALTFVLAVLVITPLVLLVLNSFRSVSAGQLDFGLDRFTVSNYVEAYSNSGSYTMLLNSVWFALGSMTVAIVIGGCFGFLYERTDFRFRGTLAVVAVLPLAMPGIVHAVAWVSLLSPNSGLINVVWRGLGFHGTLLSAYSVPAMIWVEGYSMVTLSFLLLGAIMRSMDPTFEEAALASGAPMRRTLRKITIPMIWPGIVAVALLLFIRGIEAFEVPLVLGFNAGIPVFSTNIYFRIKGAFPPDYGGAFAFSATLLVITVAGMLLYQRQTRYAESYSVVTGKAYRPRRLRLGRGQWLASIFVAAFAFFAVLLPLFILLWTSLLPYYQTPSAALLSKLSFNNYMAAITSPNLLQMAINTVVLMVGTAAGVMFVSFLASWFVYRTAIRGRYLLDFIVFLPYAISGMVVAVAILVVCLILPNPIYNTIWIIVLAYIINYMPVGSRFTHPAIVQVSQDLEEAARGAGANFWTTVRRIWIPLLSPALINGGLYVGIVSIKVMTLAAVLQGPDSEVFAVYLMERFTRNNGAGQVAALSVMFVVFVALMIIIARWLRQFFGHEQTMIEPGW